MDIRQINALFSKLQLRILSLIDPSFTQPAQAELFEDIILYDDSDLKRLLAVLRSNPKVGLFVKRLSIIFSYNHGDGSECWENHSDHSLLLK